MIDITQELKNLIDLENEMATWYISYFLRRELPEYHEIPRRELEIVEQEYAYLCQALGREQDLSMQGVYRPDHPIIARVLKRLQAVPR